MIHLFMSGSTRKRKVMSDENRSSSKRRIIAYEYKTLRRADFEPLTTKDRCLIRAPTYATHSCSWYTCSKQAWTALVSRIQEAAAISEEKFRDENDAGQSGYHEWNWADLVSRCTIEGENVSEEEESTLQKFRILNFQFLEQLLAYCSENDCLQ